MADSDDHDSESSSSTPDVEETPFGYVDPDSLASMAPDSPAEWLAPNPLTTAAKAMEAQNKEQRVEQQEALEEGDEFEFDADELDALRDKWKDLADELSRLNDNARALGQASPPADEPASDGQIKAVRKHARVCAELHEQMYSYTQEYGYRLDNALKKLKGSDQDAEDSINTRGRSM